MPQEPQNQKYERRQESTRLTFRFGWATLFTGILIGALAVGFYNGIRSGDPHRLGSGLNQLFEKPVNAKESSMKQPSLTNEEPARTTFDFFTVLPEIERLIPEVSDNPNLLSEADKSVNSEKDGDIKDAQSYYMLQVASYNSESEAVQMKKKLTDVGFPASVQHISIQNQGDFFRVRIGPFFSMNSLEKVNDRLSSMKIDALRLKVSRP
ncbi:MAG: hypothetical protein CL402_10440 [Acidiferrobacteraceae bacterium]|nr:hypothetical protein [Acidiferrobacteraceae bacterium]|tara:strand:+ start:3624 stop:4250 length:627 start_codon:yes stop_codon:yes gene_type:complete